MKKERSARHWHRTSTNWTLQGMPIENGFDVVADQRDDELSGFLPMYDEEELDQWPYQMGRTAADVTLTPDMEKDIDGAQDGMSIVGRVYYCVIPYSGWEFGDECRVEKLNEDEGTVEAKKIVGTLDSGDPKDTVTIPYNEFVRRFQI